MKLFQHKTSRVAKELASGNPSLSYRVIWEPSDTPGMLQATGKVITVALANYSIELSPDDALDLGAELIKQALSVRSERKCQ